MWCQVLTPDTTEVLSLLPIKRGVRFYNLTPKMLPLFQYWLAVVFVHEYVVVMVGTVEQAFENCFTAFQRHVEVRIRVRE